MIRNILLAVILMLPLIFVNNAGAGDVGIFNTDYGDRQLIGFFDLRDRESFIQITNTDNTSFNRTIHIQFFDVGNNCNENNFFDNYTQNDTHLYNVRDIVTNDGNPPGVILPDGAYGIFVATYIIEPISPPAPPQMLPPAMIGNVRIEDNNGYEYRTNLVGTDTSREQEFGIYTFNFNSLGNVTVSDIVGIALDNTQSFAFPGEVFAADIVNTWVSFDIDIYNEDEVPFSCRNVIFACTDQDNPQLPALLEESGDANVASFEYGINNSIPHSKGGELLCPGNTISDGLVRLTEISLGEDTDPIYFIFAGLNNGNGRGSIDSIWNQSNFTLFSLD